MGARPGPRGRLRGTGDFADAWAAGPLHEAWRAIAPSTAPSRRTIERALADCASPGGRHRRGTFVEMATEPGSTGWPNYVGTAPEHEEVWRVSSGIAGVKVWIAARAAVAELGVDARCAHARREKAARRGDNVYAADPCGPPPTECGSTPPLPMDTAVTAVVPVTEAFNVSLK